MESVNFYEELKQKNEDLEILISLIQAVYKSSNLEEIYRVALDSVVELENVDAAVIYLVDEEKREAVLQAHRNLPEDYIRRASRIPHPKGVTWKVINTGRMLNVEDVQKDQDVGPAGRDLGHHGVLGIPLSLEERVIGVIWFVSYKERRFNEREVSLLSTLGDEIAIAISKAKQTKKLEERNRNLSILSTISQTVHQSVDLDQIYKTVLDITKELKFIDLMAVYLVEGEGDKREAVLQVHRGYTEEYLKRAGRIPYPRGNTWKVINSGEPVYYEDASDPSTPLGPAGKALGQRALLSVPVKSGNKTIGVVHFSSLERTSFTKQELDFLLSLGSQIGTAISKAKMFEEMKLRAQELKDLYESLKSTQEQLIQTEKLASLGQLVSSVAHEINNPLTPILGYSHLLLDNPEIDKERRQRFLEIIYASADRVRKVVENLLSFAQEHKLGKEYVDINYLVEKALEFRGYQLRLSSIEVVKNLDPKLPKTMADSSQIQQVFINIILNAEQAMCDAHNKGQLKVMTRAKKEGVIEISFSDDGPGIRKEILGKIFDPFFTTKPVGKGTGLGLSTSYGIIKEHGGEIYALSEEGKGATLIINLPILEESILAKG